MKCVHISSDSGAQLEKANLRDEVAVGVKAHHNFIGIQGGCILAAIIARFDKAWCMAGIGRRLDDGTIQTWG